MAHRYLPVVLNRGEIYALVPFLKDFEVACKLPRVLRERLTPNPAAPSSSIFSTSSGAPYQHRVIDDDPGLPLSHPHPARNLYLLPS
ncbi:MAG: hypothetical protein R3B51_05205 [Thermodesulfobacteriota bacterium]